MEDRGGPGLLQLLATHHVAEELALRQGKGQTVLLCVRSSRSSWEAPRGQEAAHSPELRGCHRDPAGAPQRGCALRLRASGGLGTVGGALAPSSPPVLSSLDSSIEQGSLCLQNVPEHLSWLFIFVCFSLYMLYMD